ncbi:hypothetical protein H0H87_011332 [Tephrocybe sp. NHM501043]|nr:hypothetical protein H0H87_011332 [Tephrocybe sp. NHM501043]
MIWDNKYSSFLTYLKIRDTRSDTRDKAYSTHNPSIIYKSRKDQIMASGKEMEHSTLAKLAEAFGTKPEHSGIVQHVGTSNGRMCEWYEIYLGQEPRKAALAKKALRDMLKQYGEEATDKFSYGGETQEEFISKFMSLFSKLPGISVAGQTPMLLPTLPQVIFPTSKGKANSNWWKDLGYTEDPVRKAPC